tara:strand:- start:5172 stop:5594 length:423 start_codon:yes stop_codon:yes gene_type:complete
VLFSKIDKRRKKLRRKILFGMAFATMLVCISSCDKTKPSTNKLTGTWDVISIDGETLTADEKIVFDFRSDETFDFTAADSSAIGGGSAAGTWYWYNDKTGLKLSWTEDGSTFVLDFENISLTKEDFLCDVNFSNDWVLKK